MNGSIGGSHIDYSKFIYFSKEGLALPGFVRGTRNVVKKQQKGPLHRRAVHVVAGVYVSSMGCTHHRRTVRIVDGLYASSTGCTCCRLAAGIVDGLYASSTGCLRRQWALGVVDGLCIVDGLAHRRDCRGWLFRAVVACFVLLRHGWALRQVIWPSATLFGPPSGCLGCHLIVCPRWTPRPVVGTALGLRKLAGPSRREKSAKTSHKNVVARFRDSLNWASHFLGPPCCSSLLDPFVEPKRASPHP